MTKPETRDGLELPDKPGVWFKDKYAIVVFKHASGDLRYWCWNDTCWDSATLGQLSSGGWFPAVPATPAPDLEAACEELKRESERLSRYKIAMDLADCRAILRKHFRSPAEGELARVMESACRKLVEVIDANPVHARDDHDESACIICSTWARLFVALKAFRQHADQPAAVSPAANSEITWAIEKLQSELQVREELQHRANVAKARRILSDAYLAQHASPAAPAEQGNELAALRQLNIDHCADEERIKALALPILGEKRVNGEGYFVSSLQVVEMLVEELASLKAAKETNG